MVPMNLTDRLCPSGCLKVTQQDTRGDTGGTQGDTGDARCTFGLSGAQQGITGDDHVQDGFSEVGVEMSDGG